MNNSHIKYDGVLRTNGDISALYYLYSTEQSDYLITVNINGVPRLYSSSNGVGEKCYLLNEDELEMELTLTNEDDLIIPLYNLVSLVDIDHIKADSVQMLFEELFKETH